MGVQVAVDAFEGPLRCTQAVNGGRRAFDRTPHVCEPHLGLAFDVGCDRRLDLGLVALVRALERLLDRPSNRFGSRSALDTDSARLRLQSPRRAALGLRLAVSAVPT